jgi:methyl-accepting chemotaxis protein
MEWFRNMRIGGKITTAFVAILLLLAVLGGVALLGTSDLKSKIETINADYVPSIVESQKLRSITNRVMIKTYADLFETAPDSLAAIEADLQSELDSLATTEKRYEPMVDPGDEAKGYEQFKAGWADLLPAEQKVLECSRQGRKPEAIACLKSDMKPAFNRAIGGVKLCIETNQRQSRIAGEAGAAKSDRIIGAVAAVALLALVLVGFLRSLLVAAVAKPLARVAEVSGHIQHGDLTIRLGRETRDEIGDLQGAFGEMVTQLHRSIAGIRDESQGLAAAAEEMSTVAGDLDKSSHVGVGRAESLAAASTEMDSSLASVAATTEQSSSNLERIAAAIEEMASSIGEIARNAERSRASAREAVATVAQSSRSVEELANASQEISKVVESIVEIAEQTKLLALNATIEAARAGEAGKGFAVVASEVKELAKGTADATEDIRRRIETMQLSTRQTIGQIRAISGVIGEVDALVGGIAAAVEQQSATTREIAGNASEASRGIAEATRMVAQAAATSSEVSSEAEVLRDNARHNNEISRQTRTTAGELARMASSLKAQIGQYRLD